MRFGACYTYKMNGAPTRYIYQTVSLGDAITHVESVFRQGYLVIKLHNQYYVFVPLRDIESITARVLMEGE
jgi:hypothetical protein